MYIGTWLLIPDHELAIVSMTYNYVTNLLCNYYGRAL